MRPFQLLIFTLLLLVSTSSRAQCDYYYCQGLDLDFALADENPSLKTTLEGLLNKITKLINLAPEDGMGIGVDLSYFTKMDRQTDNH